MCGVLSVTVVGLPLLAFVLSGCRLLRRLERGRPAYCCGCGSRSRLRCGRAGTEVVAQLLGRSRRQDVLAGLTPREREVLGLMAEGRTNSAIAGRLVAGHGAVEKHVSNIFLKLGLPQSDAEHRRVLAVLTCLNS